METVDDLLGPANQGPVDALLGPPRDPDIIPATGKSAYDSFKLQESQGTPYSYNITGPPSMNPDWDFVRETKGQPALMLAGKAVDVLGKKVIGPVASQVINQLHKSMQPENELYAAGTKAMTGVDISKYDMGEAKPGVPMVTLPKLTPQEKEAAQGWEKELGGFGEGLSGMYEGFPPPEAIVPLPFAEAKPVQAAFATQMAASLPDSLQALDQARTPDEKAKAFTSLALNLGMVSLLTHSMMKEGGPRARENQEAAEVHGNVRPQPGQGEGQVPAQEGGGGVQSSAQAEDTAVSLKPEHQAL